MFQSNQSYAQVSSVLPFLAGTAGAVAFGLVLVVLVGLVIMGGIKRIGEVAAGLVPFMCSIYVLCGLCSFYKSSTFPDFDLVADRPESRRTQWNTYKKRV